MENSQEQDSFKKLLKIMKKFKRYHEEYSFIDEEFEDIDPTTNSVGLSAQEN